MALPLPGADYAKRAERYAAAYAENEEMLTWLQKECVEEVLEPELPIVDPHHHLWDHRPVAVDGEKSAHISVAKWWDAQKVYMLPEFLEDVYDGHNVVATVHVEAGNFHRATGPLELRPVGEVEVCQGIAAMCQAGLYGPARVCAGILGHCDLFHQNAEEVLRSLMRCRNFRGVRAAVADDAATRTGLQLLQKYELVLELWDFPLPRYNPDAILEFTALAKDFPGLSMVLEHLGGAVGPSMGGPEVEARWRSDVAALARSCPNVVCKVGGLQMFVNGFHLHDRATPIGSKELAELMFPWYGHVIDCFGASRCMFESNFPCDKGAVSYRVLWNAFKRIASKKGLTQEQKKDIFHDTAVRVYKLDLEH